MQRMKSDAAAIGIVDGAGNKMIEIDKHGRHHHKPNLDPPIGIGQTRYSRRNSYMEKDMDSCHGLIPESCMKFKFEFPAALQRSQ